MPLSSNLWTVEGIAIALNNDLKLCLKPSSPTRFVHFFPCNHCEGTSCTKVHSVPGLSIFIQNGQHLGIKLHLQSKHHISAYFPETVTWASPGIFASMWKANSRKYLNFSKLLQAYIGQQWSEWHTNDLQHRETDWMQKCLYHQKLIWWLCQLLLALSFLWVIFWLIFWPSMTVALSMLIFRDI